MSQVSCSRNTQSPGLPHTSRLIQQGQLEQGMQIQETLYIGFGHAEQIIRLLNCNDMHINMKLN